MMQLILMTVLCPVSGKFGQIWQKNSNFPPKFKFPAKISIFFGQIWNPLDQTFDLIPLTGHKTVIWINCTLTPPFRPLCVGPIIWRDIKYESHFLRKRRRTKPRAGDGYNTSISVWTLQLERWTFSQTYHGWSYIQICTCSLSLQRISDIMTTSGHGQKVVTGR